MSKLETDTHEFSHLTKRVFRSGSIIFLFTLLTAPLGYAIRIAYSHTLSIQDFGLFYAVLSFLSVFNNYNDLGLGSSLVFFIPKFIKKSDYVSAWNAYKYSEFVSTVISLILAFLFFLMASWLSIHYFKSPEAKNLIIIFAVYHIADVFVSISSRFLTGLQKEEMYSSREFIRSLLTFIFSFLVIILGYKNIQVFAIVWAFAYGLTGVVFYYFVYKKHAFVITPLKWDRKLLTKLLKYGIPSTLTLLLTTLITSTNTFLITLLRGVKEFGIYSIVWSIVSIPAIFVASVSVFLPAITSSLMEGEEKKVRILINNILIYIPFFTFYFVLFILMFPSSSIFFLFGSKWVPMARIPLMVLIGGTFFSTISDYLIAILLGIGLVKERLRISLIVTVINIFLGILLIGRFGLLGAAVSNVIIYIVLFLFLSSLLKLHVSFAYPIRFYLKLLLFGTVAYLIRFRLKINPTNVFQFIAIGILYSGIVFIFSYQLKLFNLKMVKKLISYYNMRVRKK